MVVRQGSFNRCIRVLKASTTLTMMGFASPCIYGCIIYPERNRAPFAQSLIVLRPVSYLLFRLTHVVTARTIIKGQIAGLEKGSTDLGNNASNNWSYCYLSALMDSKPNSSHIHLKS